MKRCYILFLNKKSKMYYLIKMANKRYSLFILLAFKQKMNFSC